MKRYRLYNNLVAGLCFFTAFIVYMLTLQPTVSFWDCGEFISTAYKIQVGHEPGATLFVMIGKIFSLIASDPKQVAFWVNTGSALAGAATVMFLFKTITLLALKVIDKKKDELLLRDIFLVTGAAATGALAYAFCDSFWFSAVEAEVYALSSLGTAIVFWAALKWDAEADSPRANRWLVFIAYIIGLSIGIHLLSLLTIPAVVLICYFRKTRLVSLKGIFFALLAGCAVLGFVQYGIIQYLLLFASKLELFFVNTLGLAFGSGAIFFAVLLVAMLVYGIIGTHKKQKPYLNLALICTVFILLGYSSYAMIYIRANAKTRVNVGNPDNVFALLGYLSREQYEEAPLLYGPYFDSEYTGSHEEGNLYRKGEDRYELAGTLSKAEYDRNTVFPRMYSKDARHVQFYRSWLGIPEGRNADFADNIGFFSSYQLGFMYWRYFLWNFAGKQNDEQGQGDKQHGNWITGAKTIDALRLGNQSSLPISVTANEGYNRFYALPLIIGLLGFIFHFRRNSKDASVIALFFFCTGIAIILYLNQSPLQVRERDYAYVGSFYAFAVWIGLGVIAVRQLFARISPPVVSTGLALALGLAAAPFLMGYEGWDDHNRSDNEVAHDMAVNYLESCAPNAILFTNADNDTYPLWYAQEVEGVRRDVRIVNLQLLYNDSYIDALKKKLYSSQPLPLTMPKSKYVKGTRDYLPYMDYGLTDSVELSDLFEVLVSDNEQDKIEMQDGSKLNFLPTKKFRLMVNPEQVLKTGTVSREELPGVSTRMEWTYNKNYVTRSDLAVIDILAHNNWKRPVYFAASLSDDSYFGLDRYLYLEGYAYRLLPLKRDAGDNRDKSDVTHGDVLYTNLLGKFHLDAFNKASYLDPESRRVSRMTWDTFNSLASDLNDEGKAAKAKAVMNRALAKLPLRNYSITDTVIKLRTAANLYRLNETGKANRLVKDAAGFLGSELRYYASLDEDEQRASADTIRYVAAVMEAFRKEASDNRQKETAEFVEQVLRKAGGRLGLKG